MPLTYHELTSLTDDLLFPWLDLYELSFPPQEKILVSDHLAALKDKMRGQGAEHTLLAALDSTGDLVGMARYHIFSEHNMAVLWYLATAPHRRSQGLGGEFFEEILSRTRTAAVRFLIYEVEIPEHAHDPALARRRIQFYRRHGAQILTGIHYLQSVGTHLPPTPMHLLMHPFQPVSPQQVFDCWHALVGDLLRQTGAPEFA